MVSPPPSLISMKFHSPLFLTSSSPSSMVSSSSLAGSEAPQTIRSSTQTRWDGWRGRYRSSNYDKAENDTALTFDGMDGRPDNKDHDRRNLIEDFDDDDDDDYDDVVDDDDCSLDSLDEIIEFYPTPVDRLQTLDENDNSDADSDPVDKIYPARADNVMDRDEQKMSLGLFTYPISSSSPLHVPPGQTSVNLIQHCHSEEQEEHVVMTTTTTTSTTTKTTTCTSQLKKSYGRATSSAMAHLATVGPSSMSSSSLVSNESKNRKETFEGTTITNNVTPRRPFVYPQFLTPESKRNKTVSGGRVVTPTTTKEEKKPIRQLQKAISTSVYQRPTIQSSIPSPPHNELVPHQQESKRIDGSDRILQTVHSTCIVPSYGHPNRQQLVPFHESSQHGSMITTTLEQPCPCCVAKQKELDRAEDDLQHMKNMVKKLLGIVSDMARNNGCGDQSQSPNYTLEGSISGSSIPELMPPPLEDAVSNDDDGRVRCTEHVETKENVPATRHGSSRAAFVDKNNNPSISSNDDTVSVGSTESTKSSSCSTNSSSITSASTTTQTTTLPPPTPPRKITSLPLTMVNDRCPRSKNQRIRVNGQWGKYSGPALKQKNHTACVLQGCVVRMEETGELYVGSLHRNDTGSCTFHPPGTLYGVNGAPKRRIR
jgi:hypothetical protein